MQHPITRRILADLASALALLTRLPVPDHIPQGANTAWAWPVVGGALGVVSAILASALLACGLPPGPAAAFTLAGLALLTGALHEDGLADTADGLLGGRSRETRLAIMKDSRIGSFGALALVLVTLAAWSALSQALTTASHWAALPAAAALSRAAMVATMAALPAARPQGLSAATGRPRPAVAALSAALALALALVLCGAAGLKAALAAALVAAALARTALRLIGGQTGDILGATQALTFAIALALCA